MSPTSSNGRRGKRRTFDFDAVAHVGNDADEGGFLADEDAELERVAQRDSKAAIPAPAHAGSAARSSDVEANLPDPRGTAGPVSAPTQEAPAFTYASPTAAAADRDGSVRPALATPPASPRRGLASEAATDTPVVSARGVAAVVRPAVQATPVPELKTPSAAVVAPEVPVKAELVDAVAEPPAPARRQRANDGPDFSAAGADLPLLKLKARTRKPKLPPAQAQLVQSYNNQRTGRNWVVWSGRLVPDVERRLELRAQSDSDALSKTIRAGHLFDAALRLLPTDPEEQAALADEWLLDRWGGQHPTGKGAQFSVSPEAHAIVSGLSRSLKGQRHGIVIDVISAAADILLDMLDDEGPLKSF